MSKLQTQLIGVRVEIKSKPNWHSDIDSDRDDLVGVIRSVAASHRIGYILQIEDDEGWIHTRTTATNKFRVIKANEPVTLIKMVPFKTLSVGTSFQFVNAPQGWFDGKLVKVESMPGWAAPEGWGYVLATEPELQDVAVFAIDEAPPPSGCSFDAGPQCEQKGTCECLDGCGACDGCGRWLGDEPHRIKG